MINFLEGDGVSGLEERRNFYFFELDYLTTLFKKSFVIKEKGIEKTVQVTLNGVPIFREKLLFKDQDVGKIILDELDSTSRKSIHSIIKREKELVQNEEFKMFLIRYDQVLCSPDRKPIPFLMDIEKSYKVYKAISDKLKHLFYSKLSVVMKSLEALNNLVVRMINDNLSNSDLQTSYSKFLNNEKNFEMYCSYVPTRISSLSPNRINALYPNDKFYQRYQDILFKHLAFYFGFDEVYRTHLALLKRFEEEFHLKLFNGDSFTKDEDFSIKIFSPVINNFLEKSVDKARKMVEEQGLDESILSQINEY